VDGSHIRTLLLTFFFRQMPEIVERGHLYIAQPPLYKAKRGKKEIYLKDETALQEYLLAEGVEGMTLELPEIGKTLRGKQIIPTLRQIIAFNAHFERKVQKGINREVLRIFVEGKMQNGYGELDDLSPVAEKLKELEPRGTYQVFNDPPRILFTLGNIRARIDRSTLELLSSHEYRLLLQAYRQVENICKTQPAKVVTDDGREQNFGDRQELLDFFLDRARKGQYIQRYKGLGEMNPEQLWETTMDPEKRVLLQVKIEDAVEADEIFTVLMGDQVEPRREFIENNALNVSNLDI
ncbi:MAG: DNA gyrase subunit B, partial [Deltaproteobacteria bacterium]